MNCAPAVRMLDAYIDDELDAVTSAQIIAHLAACPACTLLRDQRVAMRTALRGTGLRHVAPPQMGKAILRGIKNLEQPPAPSRLLRWWQAAVLAASTAALGIIAGWWLGQPHALDALPEYAVTRHVASLTPDGPRVDMASSDRHVVRPWFQGRLEFAPTVRDLSAQGFDLLGARLDHLANRQAGVIVYRLHGHVINVFSWRASEDSAELPREATVRGYHVVTWREGDLAFAAVSDAEGAELKRFAAAYQAN
jgi:anti-sigma factor RsiW